MRALKLGGVCRSLQERKAWHTWGVEVYALWLELKRVKGEVSHEARGEAAAGYMPAWRTWIVS